MIALAAAIRAPALGSISSASASVALLAFMSWYLLSFSIYAAREQRPTVGDVFPDFALTDSTGQTFRLMENRGKRLLVLLYRGDW
ncbi:MAG: redoxin domain-containing protein [Caldilineaceae bacterium]|nr:redoxin domain-containing protein [Caldilineaceae bacterium]